MYNKNILYIYMCTHICYISVNMCFVYIVVSRGQSHLSFVQLTAESLIKCL